MIEVINTGNKKTKDSFDDYKTPEKPQIIDKNPESVLIFDFPTISADINETKQTDLTVVQLLSDKASSRTRKMKSFNYQFNKKTVDFIEEESYYSYLNYIEKKFQQKKIKKSEYKILIKFLINYLETENKPIIKNANSDFKHKIRTLISEL